MASADCTFELLDADASPWLASVRTLFREYAQWLNVDPCLEGFEGEVAGLPGAYARARGGALLLARDQHEPAGCVALRALGHGICEMKRLWVRDAYRGSGLGRMLAQAVLQRARDGGYQALRLDTLAHMDRARQLYARLGFREIPPYYASVLPNTIYLELALRT
jgi:putative acetyltransferase